jgi:hypothetical protein
MQHPVQMVPTLSRAESGQDVGMTTALFNAKVKQRVDPYFHSHLSSWQVKGQTLHLLHCYKRISVKLVS